MLPFYWVHLKFYYDKNHESKTKVKITPKEEGTSCEIGGSAVMLRIRVFWDVMLCRLMSISWCFEGSLQ